MWLELWVGNGRTEVTQAATLTLWLLGQGGEVDFILNVVGSQRKVFFVLY